MHLIELINAHYASPGILERIQMGLQQMSRLTTLITAIVGKSEDTPGSQLRGESYSICTLIQRPAEEAALGFPRGAE